jgi:hypothetical protein
LRLRLVGQYGFSAFQGLVLRLSLQLRFSMWQAVGMATRKQRRKRQREKERQAKRAKEGQESQESTFIPPHPSTPAPPSLAFPGVPPRPLDSNVPVMPSAKDSTPDRRKELRIDGSLTVLLGLLPFGWQMLGFPNAPIAGVCSWAVCLVFLWRIIWIITENHLGCRSRHVVSGLVPMLLVFLLWSPVSRQINKPRRVFT